MIGAYLVDVLLLRVSGDVYEVTPKVHVCVVCDGSSSAASRFYSAHFAASENLRVKVAGANFRPSPRVESARRIMIAVRRPMLRLLALVALYLAVAVRPPLVAALIAARSPLNAITAAFAKGPRPAARMATAATHAAHTRMPFVAATTCIAAPAARHAIMRAVRASPLLLRPLSASLLALLSYCFFMIELG